jgi:hypothetical protein
MTPKQLREQLGLNKTQAGRLILGIDDKDAASSTWGKMERDCEAGRKLSNAMRELIAIWSDDGDRLSRRYQARLT